MALGATAPDVIRLVLRQSLGLTLAGISAGGVGAFGAGRLLERLVTGVRAAEPSTYAVMILVLAVAALCASYLPARRASRIDPMKALRQE